MGYNTIEIHPVNDHMQVRSWITHRLAAFDLFFIGESGHETIFLPKTPPSSPRTPEDAVAFGHKLWDSQWRETLFANQAVAHAFYAFVAEVGQEQAVAELQGYGLTAEFPKISRKLATFDGLGPDYSIAPDTCSFELAPELVVVISRQVPTMQHLREADVPGIITRHATSRLCDIHRQDASKTHLQRYADAGFAGDLGL